MFRIDILASNRVRAAAVREITTEKPIVAVRGRADAIVTHKTPERIADAMLGTFPLWK